jgi:serine/threonine protein kinase/WD40 repeat protein
MANHDDEFASEAEAFEIELRRDRGASHTPSRFEREHSKVASVLRLLNEVFQPGQHGQAAPPQQLADLSSEGVERLGRFRLLDEVGRGGFGVVYRAFDEVLEREVALKVIALAENAPAQQIDRLLAEARAVARLSHPNIVPLYDVQVIGRLYCLISEYCEGTTLDQWLQLNAGPVDGRAATSIVLSLSNALDHAHERRLVHGDVKPANILLPQNESRSAIELVKPRITDFGMARDLRTDLPAEHAKTVAGTFEYMAPEQLTRGTAAVTPSCDIYALGVLYYRLLTGRMPFHADSPLPLLDRICSGPVTPPRTIVSSLSRDAEAICVRCLERSPADRYATVRELADDLQRLQRGESVAARPENIVSGAIRLVRRNPREATLFAAVFLSVVALTVILAYHNRTISASREQLSVALDSSRRNEHRAISAEQDTAAALREADHQRALADGHRKAALETAFRSDLPRVYEAWNLGKLPEAANLVDRIADYCMPEQKASVAFRMARAWSRCDWQQLTPHTAAATEVLVLDRHHCAITSSEDGIVTRHHLDRKTSDEIFRIEGGRVSAIACSPDAKLLAIGHARSMLGKLALSVNTLAILDLETGAVLRSTTGFPATIESIRFSPDGSRLAVGPRYRPVQLRDAETLELIGSFPSTRRNSVIEFVGNGDQIVIHSENDGLTSYDVMSGEKRAHLTTTDAPHHFAVSPDGRYIAVIHFNDPTVFVYDRTSPSSPYLQLQNDYGETSRIVFSQSGYDVALGNRNGGVSYWNLAPHLSIAPTPSAPLAPARLAPIPPDRQWFLHLGVVSALAFSLDDQIISASDNGTVIMVSCRSSLATPQRIADTRSMAGTLLRDGDHILLGSLQGQLVVRSLANPITRKILDHPTPTLGVAEHGAVNSIVQSPSADDVAALWEGGLLQLISIGTGGTLSQVVLAENDVNNLGWPKALAWNGNGQRIACSVDRRLRVWERKKDGAWQVLHDIPLDRTPQCLAFLDDGQTIAYGGVHEELYAISLGNKEDRALITGLSRIDAILWDHDTQHIALGLADGRLMLYSRDGTRLAVTRASERPFHPLNKELGVPGITLTPDRLSLIAGSNDGRVTMWRAADLQYLGELHPPDGQGPVRTIGFDSNASSFFFFQQQLHTSDVGGLFIRPVEPATPSSLSILPRDDVRHAVRMVDE